MAKNFSGGGRASTRAIQAERDAMDALPLAVKAAIWDAMQPWDATQVSDILRRYGERATVRLIAEWDAGVMGERKRWMRRDQRRVGQRTVDMPPTPHQAAQATQLRSHRHLYVARA